MREITITTPVSDLGAEKIDADGKIECEVGHKIPKGEIAFKDGADVILCRAHMIEAVISILDDF